MGGLGHGRKGGVESALGFGMTHEKWPYDGGCRKEKKNGKSMRGSRFHQLLFSPREEGKERMVIPWVANGEKCWNGISVIYRGFEGERRLSTPGGEGRTKNEEETKRGLTPGGGVWDWLPRGKHRAPKMEKGGGRFSGVCDPSKTMLTDV